MRLKALVPVGVLAMVLSAAVLSAEAQDRDRGRQGERGQARARQGDNRQPAAEARARRGDSREQHPAVQAQGGDSREQRGAVQTQRGDSREQRGAVQAQRGGGPEQRGEVQAWRNDGRGRRDEARVRPRDDRGWRDDRGRNDRLWRSEHRNGGFYGSPRAVSPRFVVPRRSPYRHYGPGPGLSVYFGIGSGYRYGSPYYGRVYGYSVPSRAYGVRRYYGDVRLEISPRGAAVYVDGYYAGIVDEFDGVFQRLTLEAGPHRIEVELPGFETRAFDVYVDPTRTVDVRGDLFPERP